MGMDPYWFQSMFLLNRDEERNLNQIPRPEITIDVGNHFKEYWRNLSEGEEPDLFPLDQRIRKVAYAIAACELVTNQELDMVAKYWKQGFLVVAGRDTPSKRAILKAHALGVLAQLQNKRQSWQDALDSSNQMIAELVKANAASSEEDLLESLTEPAHDLLTETSLDDSVSRKEITKMLSSARHERSEALRGLEHFQKTIEGAKECAKQLEDNTCEKCGVYFQSRTDPFWGGDCLILEKAWHPDGTPYIKEKTSHESQADDIWGTLQATDLKTRKQEVKAERARNRKLLQEKWTKEIVHPSLKLVRQGITILLEGGGEKKAESICRQALSLWCDRPDSMGTMPRFCFRSYAEVSASCCLFRAQNYIDRYDCVSEISQRWGTNDDNMKTGCAAAAEAILQKALAEANRGLDDARHPDVRALLHKIRGTVYAGLAQISPDEQETCLACGKLYLQGMIFLTKSHHDMENVLAWKRSRPSKVKDLPIFGEKECPVWDIPIEKRCLCDALPARFYNVVATKTSDQGEGKEHHVDADQERAEISSEVDRMIVIEDGKRRVIEATSMVNIGLSPMKQLSKNEILAVLQRMHIRYERFGPKILADLQNFGSKLSANDDLILRHLNFESKEKESRFWKYWEDIQTVLLIEGYAESDNEMIDTPIYNPERDRTRNLRSTVLEVQRWVRQVSHTPLGAMTSVIPQQGTTEHKKLTARVAIREQTVEFAMRQCDAVQSLIHRILDFTECEWVPSSHLHVTTPRETVVLDPRKTFAEQGITGAMIDVNISSHLELDQVLSAGSLQDIEAKHDISFLLLQAQNFPGRAMTPFFHHLLELSKPIFEKQREKDGPISSQANDGSGSHLLNLQVRLHPHVFDILSFNMSVPRECTLKDLYSQIVDIIGCPSANVDAMQAWISGKPLTHLKPLTAIQGDYELVDVILKKEATIATTMCTWSSPPRKDTTIGSAQSQMSFTYDATATRELIKIQDRLPLPERSLVQMFKRRLGDLQAKIAHSLRTTQSKGRVAALMKFKALYQKKLTMVQHWENLVQIEMGISAKQLQDDHDFRKARDLADQSWWGERIQHFVMPDERTMRRELSPRAQKMFHLFESQIDRFNWHFQQLASEIREVESPDIISFLPELHDRAEFALSSDERAIGQPPILHMRDSARPVQTERRSFFGIPLRSKRTQNVEARKQIPEWSVRQVRNAFRDVILSFAESESYTLRVHATTSFQSPKIHHIPDLQIVIPKTLRVFELKQRLADMESLNVSISRMRQAVLKCRTTGRKLGDLEPCWPIQDVAFDLEFNLVFLTELGLFARIEGMRFAANGSLKLQAMYFGNRGAARATTRSIANIGMAVSTCDSTAMDVTLHRELGDSHLGFDSTACHTVEAGTRGVLCTDVIDIISTSQSTSRLSAVGRWNSANTLDRQLRPPFVILEASGKYAKLNSSQKELPDENIFSSLGTPQDNAGEILKLLKDRRIMKLDLRVCYDISVDEVDRAMMAVGSSDGVNELLASSGSLRSFVHLLFTSTPRHSEEPIRPDTDLYRRRAHNHDAPTKYDTLHNSAPLESKRPSQTVSEETRRLLVAMEWYVLQARCGPNKPDLHGTLHRLFGTSCQRETAILLAENDHDAFMERLHALLDSRKTRTSSENSRKSLASVLETVVERRNHFMKQLCEIEFKKLQLELKSIRNLAMILRRNENPSSLPFISEMLEAQRHKPYILLQVPEAKPGSQSFTEHLRCAGRPGEAITTSVFAHEMAETESTKIVNMARGFNAVWDARKEEFRALNAATEVNYAAVFEGLVARNSFVAFPELMGLYYIQNTVGDRVAIFGDGSLKMWKNREQTYSKQLGYIRRDGEGAYVVTYIADRSAHLRSDPGRLESDAFGRQFLVWSLENVIGRKVWSLKGNGKKDNGQRFPAEDSLSGRMVWQRIQGYRQIESLKIIKDSWATPVDKWPYPESLQDGGNSDEHASGAQNGSILGMDDAESSMAPLDHWLLDYDLTPGGTEFKDLMPQETKVNEIVKSISNHRDVKQQRYYFELLRDLAKGIELDKGAWEAFSAFVAPKSFESTNGAATGRTDRDTYERARIRRKRWHLSVDLTSVRTRLPICFMSLVKLIYRALFRLGASGQERVNARCEVEFYLRQILLLPEPVPLLLIDELRSIVGHEGTYRLLQESISANHNVPIVSAKNHLRSISKHMRAKTILAALRAAGADLRREAAGFQPRLEEDETANVASTHESQNLHEGPQSDNAVDNVTWGTSNQAPTLTPQRVDLETNSQLSFSVACDQLREILTLQRHLIKKSLDALLFRAVRVQDAPMLATFPHVKRDIWLNGLYAQQTGKGGYAIIMQLPDELQFESRGGIWHLCGQSGKDKTSTNAPVYRMLDNVAFVSLWKDIVKFQDLVRTRADESGGHPFFNEVLVKVKERMLSLEQERQKQIDEMRCSQKRFLHVQNVRRAELRNKLFDLRESSFYQAVKRYEELNEQDDLAEQDCLKMKEHIPSTGTLRLLRNDKEFKKFAGLVRMKDYESALDQLDKLNLSPRRKKWWYQNFGKEKFEDLILGRQYDLETSRMLDINKDTLAWYQKTYWLNVPKLYQIYKYLAANEFERAQNCIDKWDTDPTQIRAFRKLLDIHVISQWRRPTIHRAMKKLGVSPAFHRAKNWVYLDYQTTVNLKNYLLESFSKDTLSGGASPTRSFEERQETVHIDVDTLADEHNLQPGLHKLMGKIFTSESEKEIPERRMETEADDSDPDNVVWGKQSGSILTHVESRQLNEETKCNSKRPSLRNRADIENDDILSRTTEDDSIHGPLYSESERFSSESLDQTSSCTRKNQRTILLVGVHGDSSSESLDSEEDKEITRAICVDTEQQENISTANDVASEDHFSLEGQSSGFPETVERSTDRHITNSINPADRKYEQRKLHTLLTLSKSADEVKTFGQRLHEFRNPENGESKPHGISGGVQMRQAALRTVLDSVLLKFVRASGSSNPIYQLAMNFRHRRSDLNVLRLWYLEKIDSFLRDWQQASDYDSARQIEQRIIDFLVFVSSDLTEKPFWVLLVLGYFVHQYETFCWQKLSPFQRRLNLAKLLKSVAWSTSVSTYVVDFLLNADVPDLPARGCHSLGKCDDDAIVYRFEWADEWDGVIKGLHHEWNQRAQARESTALSDSASKEFAPHPVSDERIHSVEGESSGSKSSDSSSSTAGDSKRQPLLANYTDGHFAVKNESQQNPDGEEVYFAGNLLNIDKYFTENVEPQTNMSEFLDTAVQYYRLFSAVRHRTQLNTESLWQLLHSFHWDVFSLVRTEDVYWAIRDLFVDDDMEWPETRISGVAAETATYQKAMDLCNTALQRLEREGLTDKNLKITVFGKIIEHVSELPLGNEWYVQRKSFFANKVQSLEKRKRANDRAPQTLRAFQTTARLRTFGAMSFSAMQDIFERDRFVTLSTIQKMDAEIHDFYHRQHQEFSQMKGISSAKDLLDGGIFVSALLHDGSPVQKQFNAPGNFLPTRNTYLSLVSRNLAIASKTYTTGRTKHAAGECEHLVHPAWRPPHPKPVILSQPHQQNSHLNIPHWDAVRNAASLGESKPRLEEWEVPNEGFNHMPSVHTSGGFPHWDAAMKHSHFGEGAKMTEEIERCYAQFKQRAIEFGGSRKNALGIARHCRALVKNASEQHDLSQFNFFTRRQDWSRTFWIHKTAWWDEILGSAIQKRKFRHLGGQFVLEAERRESERTREAIAHRLRGDAPRLVQAAGVDDTNNSHLKTWLTETAAGLASQRVVHDDEQNFFLNIAKTAGKGSTPWHLPLAAGYEVILQDLKDRLHSFLSGHFENSIGSTIPEVSKKAVTEIIRTVTTNADSVTASTHKNPVVRVVQNIAKAVKRHAGMIPTHTVVQDLRRTFQELVGESDDIEIALAEIAKSVSWELEEVDPSVVAMSLRRQLPESARYFKCAAFDGKFHDEVGRLFLGHFKQLLEQSPSSQWPLSFGKFVDVITRNDDENQFLVIGGFIADLLGGNSPKDIDAVHTSSHEEAEAALIEWSREHLGHIRLEGVEFSGLSMAGLEIADWAIQYGTPDSWRVMEDDVTSVAYDPRRKLLITVAETEGSLEGSIIGQFKIRTQSRERSREFESDRLRQELRSKLDHVFSHAFAHKFFQSHDSKDDYFFQFDSHVPNGPWEIQMFYHDSEADSEGNTYNPQSANVEMGFRLGGDMRQPVDDLIKVVEEAWKVKRTRGLQLHGELMKVWSEAQIVLHSILFWALRHAKFAVGRDRSPQTLHALDTARKHIYDFWSQGNVVLADMHIDEYNDAYYLSQTDYVTSFRDALTHPFCKRVFDELPASLRGRFQKELLVQTWLSSRSLSMMSPTDYIKTLVTDGFTVKMAELIENRYTAERESDRSIEAQRVHSSFVFDLDRDEQFRIVQAFIEDLYPPGTTHSHETRPQYTGHPRLLAASEYDSQSVGTVEDKRVDVVNPKRFAKFHLKKNFRGREDFWSELFVKPKKNPADGGHIFYPVYTDQSVYDMAIVSHVWFSTNQMKDNMDAKPSQVWDNHVRHGSPGEAPNHNAPGATSDWRSLLKTIVKTEQINVSDKFLLPGPAARNRGIIRFGFYHHHQQRSLLTASGGARVGLFFFRNPILQGKDILGHHQGDGYKFDDVGEKLCIADFYRVGSFVSQQSAHRGVMSLRDSFLLDQAVELQSQTELRTVGMKGEAEWDVQCADSSMLTEKFWSE